MRAVQLARVMLEMSPSEAAAINRTITRALGLMTGPDHYLDQRRFEALKDVLEAAVRDSPPVVRDLDT